jgi:hypothetical protein
VPRAIVEGEERRGTWDVLHCPAGTEHIFLGAGEGPCVIFTTGERAPRERSTRGQRSRMRRSPNDSRGQPDVSGCGHRADRRSAARGRQGERLLGPGRRATTQTIQTALSLEHYDEIIVATLPLGVSRWMKHDAVSKVGALGLPARDVLGQGQPADGGRKPLSVPTIPRGADARVCVVSSAFMTTSSSVAWRSPVPTSGLTSRITLTRTASWKVVSGF